MGALEERVALARKLDGPAAEAGHPLLAENWAATARAFERELELIRGSSRRMDRLAVAAGDDSKHAEE